MRPSLGDTAAELSLDSLKGSVHFHEYIAAH